MRAGTTWWRIASSANRNDVPRRPTTWRALLAEAESVEAASSEAAPRKRRPGSRRRALTVRLAVGRDHRGRLRGVGGRGDGRRPPSPRGARHGNLDARSRVEWAFPGSRARRGDSTAGSSRAAGRHRAATRGSGRRRRRSGSRRRASARPSRHRGAVASARADRHRPRRRTARRRRPPARPRAARRSPPLDRSRRRVHFPVTLNRFMVSRRC